MEFHAFLSHLASYESDFKKYTDYSRPDAFVENLIDSAYADLSPAMKGDLKLFYGDSVLVPYALIANWVLGTAPDYREFRKTLQEMTADDFIALILSAEDDDNFPEEREEESFERMEAQLQVLDMDETIIEGYRELKKFPVQTMNRIRLFLDQFYFAYFEKAEDEIETFLKGKVKEHSEIYSRDSALFKKSIVKVHFDDQRDNESEYLFTTGYLNGGQQFYHQSGSRIFCYYGYQFEQLFDPEFLNRQIIELFKAVSDETRLRMIRLLSRKSWYSTELAEELDLNKATVSYHMKILTRLNIVDIALGKNKRIYYRINLDNLGDFFLQFLNSLK
ncbi:MAG: winged helix-turn-helix transcriptional regulator [Spirochaetales bacterium]|nr:winged helix-turn-helix transcriptional regulator [Spirochaetales bacterium]